MKFIYIYLEDTVVLQSSTGPTFEQIAESIDEFLIILRVQGERVEKLEAIDERDTDSWSLVEEYVDDSEHHIDTDAARSG